MAVIVALALLALPHLAFAQQIWFGPWSPNYHQPFASDWSAMYQPTPQWNTLAGQTQVYFVSTGYLLTVPDDELRAMASTLASHRIALGMPLQSVSQRPGEACGNQEGYGDPRVGANVISRLTRLGIRLEIIRIDGPIWFGHYDPFGCKLSIADLPSRVAETLRPFLQAFPDAVVGDVEGPQPLAQFPDWQANYVVFKHGLEAAIGRKLAFLHADVKWRQPDWPSAIAAMDKLAHGAGMKFGVIYNSDGDAPTDQAWVAEAKRHFDELETRYGLVPEQAVFQTWNHRPINVFPETSDAAHSFLVAQYLLPRTHLAVQRSAAGVQGRLTRVSGQPVPGARIAIEVLGDDPNSPPPVRSVSGTVPPQARFALLGLRVNSECWCSGENDLLLGPLSYQETAGGSVRYEYRYAAARSEAGLAVTPAVVANQALVRLQVATGRSLLVNSPAFAVTPGAQFQFQVPLGSLNGDGLFGTATLIWMDGQQKGFKRDNIRVGSDEAPVAAATTDASGNFAVSLPDSAHWRQRVLLLHYAGSATLRAAYAAPQ